MTKCDSENALNATHCVAVTGRCITIAYSYFIVYLMVASSIVMYNVQ